MLLAEVEYVRPKTVDEAIGAALRARRRTALAGGQTLVNVMKARAASPDVLVDLQDIEELRGVRDLGNGSVEIGAMTTCAQLIARRGGRRRGRSSARSRRRSPTCRFATAARSAATSARTIRRTTCRRSRRARRELHDRRSGGERRSPARRVLRRRLPDGGRTRRAADEDHDSAGRAGRVRLGDDRPRRHRRSSLAAASLNGGARVAIGCVDAVPVRAAQMEERIGSDFSDDERSRGRLRTRRDARPAVGRARARPTTAGSSPKFLRCAPSSQRGSGADGAGHEQPHHRHRQRRGDRVRRRGQAPARHFLRDDLDLTGTHVGCDTGNCGACTVIYNGVLAKSCMLLAIQADGASIETVEGLSRDGELTRSSRRSPTITRCSADTARRAC